MKIFESNILTNSYLPSKYLRNVATFFYTHLKRQSELQNSEMVNQSINDVLFM